MKKKISLVLFCIALFIGGCGKKTEISFDTIVDFSNASDITWKDFSKYEYTEEVQGLLYRYYNVEGNYQLCVSGKNLDSNPWTITLTNLTTNNSINILEDDVITFLGDDY